MRCPDHRPLHAVLLTTAIAATLTLPCPWPSPGPGPGPGSGHPLVPLPLSHLRALIIHLMPSCTCTLAIPSCCLTTLVPPLTCTGQQYLSCYVATTHCRIEETTNTT